jgi:SAM-dependent methyltransferase
MGVNFATLYEQWHNPAFYEQWFALLQPYTNERKSILDLGCGNGVLLALLQDAGHDVTGVDMSADMLSLAREKLGTGAKLYENDIVHFFTEKAKYDIIVSTCDTLNYLTSSAAVAQVFRSVQEMLKPGGFFFFDVHSDYTFAERFTAWSYGDTTDKDGLIWNIHVRDHYVYEHALTFFVATENGLYERFDNIQVEYFHREAQLLALLDAADLDVRTRVSDFSAVYDATGERTFIIAQKKVLEEGVK